jgi:hypothetical protein
MTVTKDKTKVIITNQKEMKEIMATINHKECQEKDMILGQITTSLTDKRVIKKKGIILKEQKTIEIGLILIVKEILSDSYQRDKIIEDTLEEGNNSVEMKIIVNTGRSVN